MDVDHDYKFENYLTKEEAKFSRFAKIQNLGFCSPDGTNVFATKNLNVVKSHSSDGSCFDELTTALSSLKLKSNVKEQKLIRSKEGKVIKLTVLENYDGKPEERINDPKFVNNTGEKLNVGLKGCSRKRKSEDGWYKDFNFIFKKQR